MTAVRTLHEGKILLCHRVTDDSLYEKVEVMHMEKASPGAKQRGCFDLIQQQSKLQMNVYP
jgi:hypothetical protein